MGSTAGVLKIPMAFRVLTVLGGRVGGVRRRARPLLGYPSFGPCVLAIATLSLLHAHIRLCLRSFPILVYSLSCLGTRRQVDQQGVASIRSMARRQRTVRRCVVNEAALNAS